MATELPLLTGPFVYLICAAFGGPGGPRLPLYTLPPNGEQTKFFVQESSPQPRARPSPRADSGPVPSRAPGAPGRGQEPGRSFLPPSTDHRHPPDRPFSSQPPSLLDFWWCRLHPPGTPRVQTNQGPKDDSDTGPEEAESGGCRSATAACPASNFFNGDRKWTPAQKRSVNLSLRVGAGIGAGAGVSVGVRLSRRWRCRCHSCCRLKHPEVMIDPLIADNTVVAELRCT